MKSELSSKSTTQTRSIERIEGHMFLKFVGLILRLAIHKVKDEKIIYPNISIDEMLVDLDVIQKYFYPNTEARYSVITKKQYELYKLFEVYPPDMKK
ncbi:MAG: hypothetical protein LBR53_09805 [Deltaproteobacteria bacterium]|jgi:hypothetical protein|nr:hypothetical protein [Deltaproteobacteria bacterium]